MRIPKVPKVILFTDMGVDDALALSFAYKSQTLEILAVCVSGGNVLPEQGIKNLGFLYALMGETVPLCVVGHRTPLHGTFHPVVEAHGRDGLGNITDREEFQGHSRSLNASNMSALAEKIQKSEDQVSLLTLSPLTDVAVLLRDFPETRSRIHELIIMGGGVRGIGNVTPCAEFNVYSDPEAARSVLCSRLPIVLVPLDATTSTRLTATELDNLQHGGSRLNEAVVGMLQYYFQFHADYEGFWGCYLHDVLAVGLAADMSLATDVRQAPVQVETQPGLTFGQTVADLRQRAQNNDSNVRIVFQVDAKRFVDRFVSVMSGPPLLREPV
jgi:inosine-uridine nucleoside N-ribohydrolase